MKGLKGKKLTQARLKELMSYDPETGVLIRRVGVQNSRKGSVVGSKNSRGYLACRVDGKNCKCHRLAWLYIYGYMPEHGLDHINRCKTDNRINNLREVSQLCNVRNSELSKNNTSGVKGVFWSAKRKVWVACIAINRRSKRLGEYKHKHNAVCARLAGEQCLGWAGCDSNSTAYRYVKNMVGMLRC